jgi:hypothetical protein
VAAAERERLDAALGEARETIARAQDAERAVAAEIAANAKPSPRSSRVATRDRAPRVCSTSNRERAAAARDDDERRTGGARRADRGGEDALDARAPRVTEADGRPTPPRAPNASAAHARSPRTRERPAARARAEREASRRGEGGRVRLAEIDAELGMLAAQFAQNPATADECADVESRYANETGDLTPRLARLREELARLQNVNLNAEAEIEELIERERFLREQIDDLARARETLLASIHEIESRRKNSSTRPSKLVKDAPSRTSTRVSFRAVRPRCGRPSPSDLAETGIEIAVQPPGKKMMPLHRSRAANARWPRRR